MRFSVEWGAVDLCLHMIDVYKRQQLSYASGEEVLLNFTPHLIPMNRGILVTAYATLKKDVSYEEVKAIYDSYYKNEKFVRVLDKDVCQMCIRDRKNR